MNKMAGATVYDRSITPCVNAGMDKYGGLMRTQTMIGEDFVAPGFSSQLENFYQKARPADRARCLELLTAINIQKQIEPPRRGGRGSVRSPQLRAQTPGPNSFREQFSTPQPTRPKTAMAAPTEDRRKHKLGQLYQTTYKREYVAPELLPADAERPRSTKGCYAASYKLSDPVGETTYTSTYNPKDHYKALHDAQAHEYTRNYPHPLQKFMVWRMPRNVNAGADARSQLQEGLSFEAMEKVCRGNCRSTYDVDYSGMPQGFDFKSLPFNLPEDWRGKVPYSLSSSMRYSYQMPDRPRELQSNVTRYGCNKAKGASAIGAVPAVSKPHLHLKPRTTYDREYIDPSTGDVIDIRDVSKQLGADTLQNQMNMCDKDQRETLKAMLGSMKSPAPPNGQRPNLRSNRSGAVQVDDKGGYFQPAWLSTWTGPV